MPYYAKYFNAFWQMIYASVQESISLIIADGLKRCVLKSSLLVFNPLYCGGGYTQEVDRPSPFLYAFKNFTTHKGYI